jgi:hypothetical protein
VLPGRVDASKATDLKTRAAGLALAVIGAFFLKLGFFDVLRDAEANAPTVSTSYGNLDCSALHPSSARVRRL